YHIRYTEDTVYPDHMIYGYIYGIARRFLGRDHSFTVKYDPELRRQDAGGSATVIHLEWEAASHQVSRDRAAHHTAD
ncbi:MAG: hypothetical protein GYB68_03145, partial [Chloroflexi bacterium]|nr:hypothetical protein [Chloroflexota bacterium]